LAIDSIIEEHNAKPNQNFTLGHNHLSDLTVEEYKKMLGGREAVEHFENAAEEVSTTCADNNSYCSAWAAQGECSNNPGYMLPNCRKSCNQCNPTPPPQPTCSDSQTDCPTWAADAWCQRDSTYMMSSCKKSCNNCGGPSPGPTPSGGIDWRTKGAVNAVKNQGQCGSCWAFSANMAMEGAHFIASGSLLSFAEQQLVDCSKSNYGCNGGMQPTSFTYYKSNFAMAESSYSYTAKNGTCRYDGRGTGVKASSYKMVTANSPSAIKAALNVQPVSILVDAEQGVFSSYKSGIMDSASCGTSLDHAVGMVGYGSENGVEYWIMRNSWGTYWGDQGYMEIKIVNNSPGICGSQKSVYTVTTGGSNPNPQPSSGKCCMSPCQQSSECGNNLFCCPNHHVCMDNSTSSTVGPNCTACTNN